METAKNIIFLKTAKQMPDDASRTNGVTEVASIEEEMPLIAKARKVLNDMEALWEIDHGAVELRDLFHLLRYYLNRLPTRHHEDAAVGDNAKK